MELDEEDKELITEDELRRAVMGNKNFAPGDDVLTYQVLRLLQKVPGNPLLQLYNVCDQHGYVPAAWTITTIIPIPKPGTDKYWSIPLNSCFSKAFERVLLTRLRYRLQEKFSPHFYGFLPQRSTHHSLSELYSRLSYNNVVAFLDINFFYIANRDIILDQLVKFGVRGNLLKLINGYPSNRNHVFS
ncbi:uncharacterized protein [Palaemon carinicauda]|uniref:uncharacterized protein n=1 Tax=Palaemon carinicauda TaxID=392227 RepID=UPI0035B68CCA